jgi:hypothetical protein
VITNKQIACKRFTGVDAFLQGLRELRELVIPAAMSLATVEKFFLPSHEVLNGLCSTAAWSSANVTEELRWTFGLVTLVAISNIAGVSCRNTEGQCEFRASGGLRFSWQRNFVMEEYTFHVIHPTNVFPDGSKLRPVLEAAGWEIRSYSSAGERVTD